MKRWQWVFVVLVVAVIAFFSTGHYLDTPRSTDAVLKSMGILQACEAYRDNPNNPEAGKKFPSTLADLVRPPFGGSSFLRNGEADTRDPWGIPYRYAVILNAKGEQEAYVWAERNVDGKLTLHGAKRQANGSIELFGLAR